MKSKFILFFIISFIIKVNSQIVNIPDANFKNYLLYSLIGIDSNGDNEVQYSEADAYSGAFFCENYQIADLTGIEAFVNLTILNCDNNYITALDLSSNLALSYVSCSSNPLVSLIIGNNTTLETLNCQYTQLQTLGLSGCQSLKSLFCSNNQLSSIDVSGCIGLEFFACPFNQIQSLNVTGISTLWYFACGNNQLTSLNVSGCVGLLNLYCNNNQLPSLNISTNIALESLNCDYNQLTSLNLNNNINLGGMSSINNHLEFLDASSNEKLTSFWCHENELIYVNIANGNNTNLGFGASSNPNLTCVQVDDATYSSLNWTDIDAQTNFSEDCGINSLESNSKKELIISQDFVNKTISIAGVTSGSIIVIIDMSGKVLYLESAVEKVQIINVSHFSKGIFFIHIANQENNSTSKLIIE